MHVTVAIPGVLLFLCLVSPSRASTSMPRSGTAVDKLWMFSVYSENPETRRGTSGASVRGGRVQSRNAQRCLAPAPRGISAINKAVAVSDGPMRMGRIGCRLPCVRVDVASSRELCL